VEFKGYEMIVEEVDHMRVSRLVVRKTAVDNENEVMSVVS
jgi:hypothetical protein